MKQTIPLFLVTLIICAACAPNCRAATIAPRNAEEAQIQLDQAAALRQNMRAANDTAERERLRERASQEAALMAIRNTAPAVASRAAGDRSQTDYQLDRTGMYAFVSVTIALLAALFGFMYIQTRRANPAPAIPIEIENAPIIKAPASMTRSKPSEPVPVMTNPSERKNFISDVDKLIEKVKERNM